MDDVFDDINLNGVEEFKYLELVNQEDGSYHRRVEMRINESRKVISEMNLVLWNSNILPKTKRLIYTCVV